MNDFTPHTWLVRCTYARQDPAREAEFDRWLRGVLADAWDEGAEAMEQHWAYGNDEPSNPYREEN